MDLSQALSDCPDDYHRIEWAKGDSGAEYVGVLIQPR